MSEQNNEYDESFSWYRKSAENNYPKASFKLAEFYLLGKGTAKKNISKAIELAAYAAERDVADAQNFLGSVYEQGFEENQDFKLAVYWWTKAAKQEHPRAIYSLGIMYKDGLGIRQDLSKSISLFEKASSMGVSRADFMLGVLYDSNQHLSINSSEKAFAYYFKAANKGIAQAQFNLGISLHKGDGVEKNDVNALMWLMIASSNNNPKASKAKDFLKNKMSHRDIIEAQNLAREHMLCKDKR